MKKEEFYKAGEYFLEDISTDLRKLREITPRLWIDHVCFRTETMVEYEKYKSEFSYWGKVLVESEVNGRPITTFALNEPFRTPYDVIYILELPAPKVNKVVKTGFEHVECVVPVLLSELAEKLKNFELDLGGMKKTFNQELEIKFSSGAIKLHNLSLESVINLEKNNMVFEPFEISEKEYRLFLIEEKLLNIGREKLKEKVRLLDVEGAKLEDAFAKVLGLSGNSVAELLSLEAYSVSELAKKFEKTWI